jgi:uncharacterized protein DUF262
MPGEALALAPQAEGSVGHPTEESITERYVSGEIRIVTEQGRTQLPELPGILDSGRYQLQPEYQRRRRWSKEKQSRLIESFIMNVPIPPIFLYEYEYAKYEVMDGLQRLSAVNSFYKDELELSGMEYWRELEGRTYSSLPPALRQGIDRRYLSSIVLLYETARDEGQAERLKQLVFERINTGGVSLSYQESRNAVSQGPLNERVVELARTPSFCKAWGIPGPDAEELANGTVRDEVLQDNRYQSMEDAEMVLRFFAHRQRTSVGPLRNMRTFLDTYWRKANATYSQKLVDDLSELFVETVDLAYDVLGDKAFYVRRFRQPGRTHSGGQDWVPRPTLLAYDVVMAAFSRHVDNAEKLRAKRDEVQRKISDLYDQNASDFDGRRTDPQDVSRRDQLITDMLQEVVSDH